MKSRKEEKQERGFAALLSILFGKHELEDVFKLSFFYPASWIAEAIAHKRLPEEKEWLAAWSVEVFTSFVVVVLLLLFFYLFNLKVPTNESVSTFTGQKATLELIELLVWEREEPFLTYFLKYTITHCAHSVRWRILRILLYS